MARAHSATKPNIFAVETAVTDKIYPENAGDEALKKLFFAKLKGLIEAQGAKPMFDADPRPGDNISVLAEQWDQALVQFAIDQQLLNEQTVDFDDADALSEKADTIAKKIFGDYVLKAGGSLANTFDAMVHAKVNGETLVDGSFNTVVGVGPSGKVFTDSLEGHIHATAHGLPMNAHIVPVDGNRIIVSCPVARDPADKYMDASLLDAKHLNVNTDMVMLGGYLFYTQNGDAIAHAALDRITELNKERRELKKPKPPIKLVLTAAAQPITEMPNYRDFFNAATAATDVIMHANTGEYRRLLEMDTEWRGPHKHKWETMLSHEEEEAKKADEDYQQDKAKANKAALVAGVEFARNTRHNLTFVVTNGAKETYIVDHEGYISAQTDKIDKNLIVNTVGAGDNFAAGYELGEALGLRNEQKIALAGGFARAVIQQDEPRLPADRQADFSRTGDSLIVSGALAALENTVRNQALLNAIKPNQHSRAS